MTKRTAFAVRFVLTFPIFDAIIFFRKLSSTAAIDFPLSEGGLFLPQYTEGGDAMYITCEELMLFCTFIVTLISLIVKIYNDKKR